MLRRALLGLLLLSPLAFAAGPPDSGTLDAQRKALDLLAPFDGLWRGPAKVLTPDGQWREFTQTERVGPLLGGTVRLVEGRGYQADGKLSFNAFAVISYSPRDQRYNFRSHAQGYVGDFPVEVRADGFSWTLPAGAGATIRYTATLNDGVWTEIGVRLVEGKEPMKMFEMAVKRVGPTDWPAAGALAP